MHVGDAHMSADEYVVERVGSREAGVTIITLISGGRCVDLASPLASGDDPTCDQQSDKITAAAAGQTELAEQLKTENAQLLARNKMLANQLRVVQHALAQARADEMDATISSAELDRIGSLQDRISELDAAKHKLTLQRNTAVIEARRLQRDLSATEDALADAERRGAASGSPAGRSSQ